MMTIADLVNKGSWIVVVQSGGYVVNLNICILNNHSLPIHVKTHNAEYDFLELFLNSLFNNNNSAWIRRYISPLPIKTIENIRYKKIKIKKIIYTSRQAFVELMSGVCPNGKYAVFFTAYTQRFWCSGRPPNTGDLGFLSLSPASSSN